MRGMSSVAILWIVVTTTACRDDNPYYCPEGRDCAPVVVRCADDSDCTDPLVCKTEPGTAGSCVIGLNIELEQNQ